MTHTYIHTQHGVNNGQALKSAAVWYRQSGNQTLPELSLSRMYYMDLYVFYFDS